MTKKYKDKYINKINNLEEALEEWEAEVNIKFNKSKKSAVLEEYERILIEMANAEVSEVNELSISERTYVIEKYLESMEWHDFMRLITCIGFEPIRDYFNLALNSTDKTKQLEILNGPISNAIIDMVNMDYDNIRINGYYLIDEEDFL